MGLRRIPTNDLPNHLLPLHTAAGCVCLAEEKPQLLGVLSSTLLVHLLDNVNSVLAESLSDRVEENEAVVAPVP